ncbi:MAG: hypothetical protein IJS78_04160 [Clostridia bacterium]|nr:hypothetical protein [Clostridia bacterium]
MRNKLLIFFAILFLLFFSGCKVENRGGEKVAIESGIFHDKNWNESIGTYQMDAVPNGDTAIKICSAIFDAMEKKTDYNNLTVRSVFFDEQDKIWIVNFGKSDPSVVGGDCSIAIKQKNGEVLRIWFGE